MSEHSNSPVVRLEHVARTYQAGAVSIPAVRDISLDIAPRVFSVIIGPSGSGKTTLLSVLGCILTPTKGEVRLCSQSIAGIRPSGLAKLRRDHIGFIFQNYHLLPTLTALDNVRLALDVRGEKADSAIAKAKNTLASVGLAHKMDAFPGALSGGEQQRVAIARAIVGDASAILADEPTGALDSENGQAIMATLAGIARDVNRAVLVVTHDPRVMAFADRIIHLEDGRIIGQEDNLAASRTAEHGRREAVVIPIGISADRTGPPRRHPERDHA
jgi:putative ABC transport system ATP-binding protein